MQLPGLSRHHDRMGRNHQRLFRAAAQHFSVDQIVDGQLAQLAFMVDKPVLKFEGLFAIQVISGALFLLTLALRIAIILTVCFIKSQSNSKRLSCRASL
jgi:hypothetical protein